jgi:hypothetical protein
MLRIENPTLRKIFLAVVAPGFVLIALSATDIAMFQMERTVNSVASLFIIGLLIFFLDFIIGIFGLAIRLPSIFMDLSFLAKRMFKRNKPKTDIDQHDKMIDELSKILDDDTLNDDEAAYKQLEVFKKHGINTNKISNSNDNE